MPRITKSDLAAFVASRPFATDESGSMPYATASESMQRACVESIAKDRASGLSGNDLRAKYGEALTGPMRRKVLRAFGLDSSATIARSYSHYSDGEARTGSSHARMHGVHAAERIAAQEEAQRKVEAAAAKREAAKQRRAQRKAQREAATATDES